MNTSSIDEQLPIIRLGLIGRGIQASKSPFLHESEASAQGIPCSYELIDLDLLSPSIVDLNELLAKLEELNFVGVNVTHPCKQQVLPLLDSLDEYASAVGAVNTIRFEPHHRIGFNTDAWGFEQSFRDQMDMGSLDVVVQFGAGGAGSATAFALLNMGARELRIVDESSERAAHLSTRMKRHFPNRDIFHEMNVAQALIGASGVVNATPVGMVSHPGSVLTPDQLWPELWVADIVYFPLETELLQIARALGCKTLSGRGMAVYQAVRAFEIFTGFAGSPARMNRNFSLATKKMR